MKENVPVSTQDPQDWIVLLETEKYATWLRNFWSGEGVTGCKRATLLSNLSRHYKQPSHATVKKNILDKKTFKTCTEKMLGNSVA